MKYTELQKSINQIIEQVAQQMYNGTYNGVYLQDIYTDMRTYCHKYIDKQFPSSIGTQLNKQLKNNIDKFLAGKNYQQFLEMKGLLTGGVNIPYDEFLMHSKSINNLYNDTWFKTENNFMGNSIKVAEKLQTYNSANEKKPNTYALKYIATSDNLTRDSHKALNGIVKPIGDSFWNSHMPPWEYNCRCSVQMVRINNLDSDWTIKSDEKIKNANLNTIKTPVGLNQNILSKGEFFNDQHPYIKGTNNTYDIGNVMGDLKKSTK